MNATAKRKIDVLITAATNKFFVELITKSLEESKVKLREKKALYNALKKEIESSPYTDDNIIDISNQFVETIGEKEITSLQAIIEAKTKELENLNNLEETNKKIIELLLSQITSYKNQIKRLEEKAKNLPESSLGIISNTIAMYEEMITKAQVKLDSTKSKMVLLNIDIIRVKYEISKLENELSELRKNYVEERKRLKSKEIIDFSSKAIDESQLLALENGIKNLEDLIALYSTDPIALGEEIKKLLDNNENDTLLQSKISTLTRLVNNFYEVPENNKLYGIQKTIIKETPGELKDRIEQYENASVQYQFASIQKTADIMSLATLITNYKLAIYKLEIITDEMNSKLSQDLSSEEKQHLKDLKKIIADKIKSIKGIITEKETELAECIAYLDEVQLSRSELQLNITNTTLKTLLLESNEIVAEELLSYEDLIKRIEMSLGLYKSTGDTILISPKETQSEIITELNSLPFLNNVSGETYEIKTEDSVQDNVDLVIPEPQKIEQQIESVSQSSEIIPIPIPEAVALKEIDQQVESTLQNEEPSSLLADITDELKRQESKVIDIRSVNITNPEALFKGLKEKYGVRTLSYKEAA